METAEGTTRASGIEYPYTVQQFETLDEAREAVDGGEDGILDIINGQQDQSAKQGPKDGVREQIDAFVDAGGDKDTLQSVVNGEASVHDTAAPDEAQDVLDAIESAQESTAEFIIGRPRRTDGLTKTAAREFGEKAREKLGDDELKELAGELGIDL